jgi:tetratricopeptide (TPR) repeat protein
MDCSAASRWSRYDDYMRHGIALARLAKGLSPGLWSFWEPNELHEIEDLEGPLFIGELAWLYNEIALALFSEGLLLDAAAVWEQVYEISRTIESPQPYGELVLESLLNLAHTLIELGRVPDAIEHLAEADRLNCHVDDKDVAGRILGFKGFCEHLQGNLRQANQNYEACLEKLQAANNRRGSSFFLTLQAELKIELGSNDAAACIRESRAASESGPHPDLVAYSRIPEGDLFVKRGDFPQARLEYEAALQEAYRIGARSLEALAKLKLAELSLEQGDAEGARRLALKALKLTNELGLGLIGTRSLIVLGRATIRGGQNALGIAYLRIAKDQGRQQQYGLRVREAEKYLREQGVMA